MGNNADYRMMQVISSLDPASGGPPVAAAQLNRGLREIGIPSEIHAPRYPVGSDLNTIGDASRIYAISRPYSLENSWSMWKGIWRASKNVSLIHIHGSYRTAAFLAYHVARLRGIPFGFQPHGVLEPYQREISVLPKRIYDFIVGRRIVKRAAYVMVASQSEYEHSADLIPESAVLVNSLGAYLDETDVAVNIGSSDDRRIVLFLGRFAKKKRPDLLIQAWGQISRSNTNGQLSKSHVLVIAGPDDYWSRQNLEQMAAEEGVSDSVAVIGPVEDPVKSSLLRAAKIFVLPSENENFAISIAEAMLAGCFVLTTSQVAASEHVLASGTGDVLPTPDLELLIDALAKATSDLLLVDQTADLATAYAARHLSWKSTAARLAEHVGMPATHEAAQ